MKTLSTLFLLLTSSVAISLPAHSALQGRDLDGNASTIEAVYDDVLKITWLADANLAKTSGYSKDGRMPWSSAMAWADKLEYYGYKNWRLPKADPSCGKNKTNCLLNELGALYYLGLGGKAAGDLSATHNANYNLFVNIQTISGGIGTYFTSTPEANAPNAWAFHMETGYQRLISKSGANYAWPVHDGDIGRPVTPSP